MDDHNRLEKKETKPKTKTNDKIILCFECNKR